MVRTEARWGVNSSAVGHKRACCGEGYGNAPRATDGYVTEGPTGCRKHTRSLPERIATRRDKRRRPGRLGCATWSGKTDKPCGNWQDAIWRGLDERVPQTWIRSPPPARPSSLDMAWKRQAWTPNSLTGGCYFQGRRVAARRAEGGCGGRRRHGDESSDESGFRVHGSGQPVDGHGQDPVRPRAGGARRFRPVRAGHAGRARHFAAGCHIRQRGCGR